MKGIYIFVHVIDVDFFKYSILGQNFGMYAQYFFFKIITFFENNENTYFMAIDMKYGVEILK